MKIYTANKKCQIAHNESRGSLAVSGNTAVTGTLQSSGALTTTAGGHTITAGGLTVTAGSSDIAVNGTDDCDFVSGNGAKCTLKAKTASITITETDTTHEEASWVPAGIMVIGAVARVTTTITGASANISLGYTNATTAFCNAKGSKLTAGATIDSYVDGAATAPAVVAAAANLVITSSSGNFSGGVIRVTMFYYDLTAPTS